jgi:hypothetical protein
MRAASERIPVDSSSVRAALDRICGSPTFVTSRRLTSFLRYVVEATLAGRGDRLKGYTIGVEALGRAESFDPQADPIVRVEATRLRRALTRYYEREGARDAVVVELPRGCYQPNFHVRRRTLGCAAWAAACAALQRLLAAEGAWLLPPALPINLRSPDVRQEQQAEGAPAEGACRPGTG